MGKDGQTSLISSGCDCQLFASKPDLIGHTKTSSNWQLEDLQSKVIDLGWHSDVVGLSHAVVIVARLGVGVAARLAVKALVGLGSLVGEHGGGVHEAPRIARAPQVVVAEGWRTGSGGVVGGE